MIDLVFSEIRGEWAIELIRGVEEVARAEGVELVLSECGGARRPRQEWIESVLNRRPLGVIMVFSDLDAGSAGAAGGAADPVRRGRPGRRCG